MKHLNSRSFRIKILQAETKPTNKMTSKWNLMFIVPKPIPINGLKLEKIQINQWCGAAHER